MKSVHKSVMTQNSKEDQNSFVLFKILSPCDPRITVCWNKDRIHQRRIRNLGKCRDKKITKKNVFGFFNGGILFFFFLLFYGIGDIFLKGTCAVQLTITVGAVKS